MSSKSPCSRSCLHIEFCHWNPPSCNLRISQLDRSLKLPWSPQVQTWQQDKQHCWCLPQGKGHILPALHGQHRVPSEQFQKKSASRFNLSIKIFTKPDHMRPQQASTRRFLAPWQILDRDHDKPFVGFSVTFSGILAAWASGSGAPLPSKALQMGLSLFSVT